MNNRDFIVFGLQAWDYGIATTIRYTAIEISRRNRVLFVNPPLTRRSYLKEKHLPEVQRQIRINKGEEPDLVQVSPTLHVLYPRMIQESINWIPYHPLFRILNRYNDKVFASRIKDAAKRLGFSDLVVLDDNNMITGFYLQEFLRPSLFIYLLRDAVTQVAYHRRHGSIMEPQIIAKSDLTVTNSESFCNFALQFNPASFMIGQGCDVSLYSDDSGDLPLPADTLDIPRPIIGYTGALTTIRLDIPLLVYIAKTRPDWSIVLVGPEDQAFRESELHQLKNVHFLGNKKPDQLPAYVKSFDVAINPQVINPITDVNYPLKVDEYLAMGKPVVATHTTFMNYFREDTYLAGSKEDYIRLIAMALEENNEALSEQRKKVARSHSWENFVNKIYRHASDILATRK